MESKSSCFSHFYFILFSLSVILIQNNEYISSKKIQSTKIKVKKKKKENDKNISQINIQNTIINKTDEISEEKNTLYFNVGYKSVLMMDLRNGMLHNIELYKRDSNGNLVFVQNNGVAQDAGEILPLKHKKKKSKTCIKNFLNSSTTNEKKLKWKLQWVKDEKENNIDLDSLNNIYKNNDINKKYTLYFANENGNINDKSMYRKLIISNSGITVEEFFNNENNQHGNINHCFTIRLPINSLGYKNSQLKILNDIPESGMYIIKSYKRDYFLNTILNNGTNKKNMSIKKLDFLVKSNNQKKELGIYLQNDRKFLLMEQDKNEKDRYIIVKKKKNDILLKYHSNGDNGIYRINILHDLNGLENTNFYAKNFPIIKKFTENSILNPIRLFFIEIVQFLMGLTESLSRILGYIIFILIIKFIALGILYFLKKKYNIERDNGIKSLFFKDPNSSHPLLSSLPFVIDFTVLMIITSINHNSSLFVMEKFLWIKDFSRFDNVSFGISKIRFSPLPIITATSIVLTGIVESNYSDNNKPKMNTLMSRIFYIIFILLISLLFYYFCHCPTSLYWAINGPLSMLFIFITKRKKSDYTKVK